MRRLIFISVFTALFLLFAESMNAKVKLPAIVSSNMVLQRNTAVEMWGWADAKEKITIEASWLSETMKVEADQDGNWRVEVKTNNSKAPQTIHIKSKTSDITLDNVLFGEVWLCSGQSNMQMPVRGNYGQPTFGSLTAIARSNNPNLRLFTVANVGSRTPLKDIEKYTAWQQATPENVPYFSAVAYFFGQQLQEILDVPVGMIHSSWGGSFVEAWMSKEVLGKYQEIDIEEANLEESNSVKTALFNAMINPLIPYTIKGALWYQGESNRMAPADYKELFPAMVKDWRTRWGIDDFPFYYVQIAPFFYWEDNTAFSQVANSAFFREAQVECLDLIPNSGIAVTTDIGNKYCIHPPRKKEVADRLLFCALNQSYGFHAVDFAGPMYESMKVKEGGIILNFKNAEMGLYSLEELEGFEIAGSDKVFYPANAAIVDTTIAISKSNRVYVQCDQVPDPVAVRYAWRNWVDGKLYDNSFLPASSFRTDHWNDAINFKEVEFKNWAQTPPMGWNSWDCYGPTVEEHEVRSNADYMAKYLKKFGWEYVVVDIRWFVENPTAGGYNQKDPRFVMDEYGRYQPAVNRFPSAENNQGFKGLADYVHQKGLKFGIHIMRGVPHMVVEKRLPVKGAKGITADQIYSPDKQCGWLRDNYTILAGKPGSQEYYNSIFELYAAWGVDFVKVDDLSAPYHRDEIEMIRKAIDHCGRPIVLSTSPGATPIEAAGHISGNANMWRMVNDVWDTWPHVYNLFEVCQKWYPYIRSGTWPDCDMIPLGRLSIRGEVGKDRMTRLTKDEQTTLMTLFTIFRSPLFFGGDLPSNDAFTLSLLSNEEVLRMHRESTNVRMLYLREGKVAITSKNKETGDVYLAMFNISDTSPLEVMVKLADLDFGGEVSITNVWNGKEVGKFNGTFSQTISAHASGLYKLHKSK